MVHTVHNIALRKKIHAFIEKNGGLASSVAIVRALLNINCDDETVARKIISPFLHDDPGFAYLESAGWTAVKSSKSSFPLSDTPFVIFAANIAETGRLQGRICEASFIQVKRGSESSSLHVDACTADRGALRGISIGAARRTLSFVNDAVIVFFEPYATFRQLLIEIGNKTGTVPNNDRLSLKKVMSSLFGLKRNVSLEEASRFLSVLSTSGESARMRARCTLNLFLALLENLSETGVDTFDGLKSLEEKQKEQVDFSSFDFDESFLDAIPETPGVYRFIDREGSPLYIGKAKNLKRRISSYFLPFDTKPVKLQMLHRSLAKIEYEETGSELQAILRESELIRSLKPPLNRQLEVHERTASYGKRGNLIIFLPGKTGSESILHFIRNGMLLESLVIKRDQTKFHRVRDLVKEVYFSPDIADPPIEETVQRPGKQIVPVLKGSAEKDQKKRRFSREIELISSYLKGHGEIIHWFDPTDYRNPSDVVRIIKAYLRAPSEGRERIIHT